MHLQTLSFLLVVMDTMLSERKDAKRKRSVIVEINADSGTQAVIVATSKKKKESDDEEDKLKPLSGLQEEIVEKEFPRLVDGSVRIQELFLGELLNVERDVYGCTLRPIKTEKLHAMLNAVISKGYSVLTAENWFVCEEDNNVAFRTVFVEENNDHDDWVKSRKPIIMIEGNHRSFLLYSELSPIARKDFSRFLITVHVVPVPKQVFEETRAVLPRINSPFFDPERFGSRLSKLPDSVKNLCIRTYTNGKKTREELSAFTYRERMNLFRTVLEKAVRPLLNNRRASVVPVGLFPEYLPRGAIAKLIASGVIPKSDAYLAELSLCNESLFERIGELSEGTEQGYRLPIRERIRYNFRVFSHYNGRKALECLNRCVEEGWSAERFSYEIRTGRDFEKNLIDPDGARRREQFRIAKRKFRAKLKAAADASASILLNDFDNGYDSDKSMWTNIFVLVNDDIILSSETYSSDLKKILNECGAFAVVSQSSGGNILPAVLALFRDDIPLIYAGVLRIDHLKPTHSKTVLIGSTSTRMKNAINTVIAENSGCNSELSLLKMITKTALVIKTLMVAAMDSNEPTIAAEMMDQSPNEIKLETNDELFHDEQWESGREECNILNSSYSSIFDCSLD